MMIDVDEDALAAVSIPNPNRAALLLGLLSKAINTHESKNETKRKNACRDTARSCIGVREELELRMIKSTTKNESNESDLTHLNIRRRLGKAILLLLSSRR